MGLVHGPSFPVSQSVTYSESWLYAFRYGSEKALSTYDPITTSNRATLAKPWRVFVSHATADQALASWVSAQLEALGMQPYLAERDRQPGVPIAEKVNEQIRACDTLLAVLTANGDCSRYVQHEIGAARMAGKPVVALVDNKLASASLGMLDGVEHIAFDPGNLAAVSAPLTAGLRSLRLRLLTPEPLVLPVCAQPALQVHVRLELTAPQLLVGLLCVVFAVGLTWYLVAAHPAPSSATTSPGEL